MSKKIWLGTEIALLFLISESQGGLQLEKELALKFAPSLQLHSRDQGLSPKPVEIMSNKKVSYLTEHDLYVRVYNILGQVVGDYHIDAGFKSNSTVYWPPFFLYDHGSGYGPNPLMWTGTIPGGKSPKLYYLLFHYDFGGPGRDSHDT